MQTVAPAREASRESFDHKSNKIKSNNNHALILSGPGGLNSPPPSLGWVTFLIIRRLFLFRDFS